MSICIYAFLGPRTEDLDARCLQAFSDLGFPVQLHPETSFAAAPAGGVLYLSVLETPGRLQRIAPGRPLLAAFEYFIEKPDKARRTADWPPREVRQYSHAVHTRTASGRSAAAYFMQTLALAILARETGGWSYCDMDEHALSGADAVKRALDELERYIGHDFDDQAYPFTSWPPLGPAAGFAWPQAIARPAAARPAPARRGFQFRYRFSIFHVPAILLLMYWLALGIISAF